MGCRDCVSREVGTVASTAIAVMTTTNWNSLPIVLSYSGSQVERELTKKFVTQFWLTVEEKIIHIHL